MIEQISVFAENKKGQLSEVIDLITSKGIDIRGLMVADGTDFGVIRMVVTDTQTALGVLAEKGYKAYSMEVLCFSIRDKIGAMNKVMQLIDRSGINVEYCYSLLGKDAKTAEIVVKTREVEEAEQILARNEVTLVTPETLV